jgi:hypothetical protein
VVFPRDTAKCAFLLLPFKEGIDICQRDCGNIIDVSYAFDKAMGAVEEIKKAYPERSVAIDEVCESRMALLNFHGMLPLARALVPSAILHVNFQVSVARDAVLSLHDVIEKQFDLWISRGLIKTGLNKQQFNEQCIIQLNEHLLKSTPEVVAAARAHPKVRKYWLALALHLPELSMIAHILSNMAATEADCERVFKWEGNLSALPPCSPFPCSLLLSLSSLSPLFLLLCLGGNVTQRLMHIHRPCSQRRLECSGPRPCAKSNIHKDKLREVDVSGRSLPRLGRGAICGLHGHP